MESTRTTTNLGGSSHKFAALTQNRAKSCRRKAQKCDTQPSFKASNFLESVVVWVNLVREIFCDSIEYFIRRGLLVEQGLLLKACCKSLSVDLLFWLMTQDQSPATR